jgi:hypothetical protein
MALLVGGTAAPFGSTEGSSSSSPKGAMLCTLCGTTAKPVTRTQGALLIELILWLCMIVPGLIYSIWRHTTRAPVCPKCGSADIIPLDSPRAKKLMTE